MNKSDILETLINYYCEGNKAKFAAMIGITPQLLSNWIKRNTLDYEQVYNGCPNMSGDWLLSGEGNIQRNYSQNDNPWQRKDVSQPVPPVNEELIRLRAENDVLREIVGIHKKKGTIRVVE